MNKWEYAQCCMNGAPFFRTRNVDSSRVYIFGSFERFVDIRIAELCEAKMAATATPAREKEYDLTSYKAFLEDNFSATKYANNLLLSTNNLYLSQLDALNESIFEESANGVGAADAELDLITAIKKIAFSIKDVNSRIARVSSLNYDSLIGEFEKIEFFQNNFDKMQDSLKQLNDLMGLLESDFLRNYEKCNQIIKRLQNLHQTYYLINELILFLDRLKLFNTSFKGVPFAALDGEMSETSFETLMETINKCLMRVSNHFFSLNQILYSSGTYDDIAQIVHDGESSSKEPRSSALQKTTSNTKSNVKKNNLFKQLKIIKDFNTLYKIEKVDRMNNFCLEILKNDQIVEEAGTSTNKDNLLVTVIITLMIFNTNDSLIEIFNRYYKHEVNHCSNLLKKILISPKNFDNSMVKVAAQSKKILQLIEVFSSVKLLTYDSILSKTPFEFLILSKSDAASTLSLNTFILKNLSISLNNKSLFTNFYRDLASQFEQMVARTLVKGGPVAKNLKLNHLLITGSIKKRILELDSETYPITEKSIEIIMMTNAVSKLGTGFA